MLIPQKRTTTVFCTVITVAFVFHLVYVFLPHFLPDESFYATIPYRLVYGDSLVRDEWHLTQFSSFFTYLPVSLWIAVKGSTEGIFIFLRLLYLLLHTIAAIIIYRLFKNYGYWAIMAALIYYLQVPYKIYAVSYNSMFALFLLFFTICTFLIYKCGSGICSFAAGFSFAMCCICNCVFAVTLLIYPISALIYTIKRKREAKRNVRISAGAVPDNNSGAAACGRVSSGESSNKDNFSNFFEQTFDFG